MSDPQIKVLIIEDDEDDYLITRDMFSDMEDGNFHLDWVNTFSQGLHSISQNSNDVYLLDYRLGEQTGLDLLREAVGMGCQSPIILLTGSGNRDVVQDALKAGASDYLVKNQITPDILERTIRFALERKQAENELRMAKEKAEKATKLKDKFVSMVSHDLKSPFNSIVGFLRLMEGDQDNPLYPSHKEMIDDILENCDGMLQMIDELLNINKLQTGKIQPKLKFHDARSLIESAIHRVRFLAENKKIELNNKVPDNARLYADWDLYSEVILNLVTNSIKFSNVGDSISLYIPEGKTTTIAVKDTGVGIKEILIPKLFKYEEKTSFPGTAGETGSGYGLPFCKDIMDVHGGDLRVDSVEGQGTTFFVELPSVRPVILIVDDETSTRQIVRKYLETLDVDIIEAVDGKNALDVLQSTEPHMVITDLNMPNLDGFGLLEEIRNNPKTKHLPVLVLTWGTMEMCEKAIRMGADDYISKPLEPHEFIPRVRKFIG